MLSLQMSPFTHSKCLAKSMMGISIGIFFLLIENAAQSVYTVDVMCNVIPWKTYFVSGMMLLLLVWLANLANISFSNLVNISFLIILLSLLTMVISLKLAAESGSFLGFPISIVLPLPLKMLLHKYIYNPYLNFI